MRKLVNLLVISLVLFLVGCAASNTFTAVSSSESPQPVSENSAVNNLFFAALDDLGYEYYQSAQSKIERALRIEPENPFLWFELAQLASLQQQPEKARELAIRASQFTSDNTPLKNQIKQFLQQY